ncbi:MAG: hypothetical protein J6Q53_06925 [Oscillospiraceae bacterium]|nr:hypothetical protein [Oscillospiraceae bacterium]
MKIRIDKDIVEFTPEHPAETVELEALWIKLGNCIGNTKSLQPIGVYNPTENKTATFHIEGLEEQEKSFVPVVRAPYDTDLYCVTCNKTLHVKAGEPIPFCCGRLMEILD